jgi:SAM-dependent methyltransferase
MLDSDTMLSHNDKEANNKLYHEAQSRMSLLPNYYRWIVDKISGSISGDVLELGVGAGIQVQFYKKQATSIVGVDYNEALLDSFKRIHPEPFIESLHCDLRGDWAEIGNRQFNTVLALDVVEHFEDDLGFLKKATPLLREGGSIIIKVPAQSELFSSVDEASGHFKRYNPACIEELARSLGLTLRKVEYMNPVGAWLYQRKRGEKKNFSKTIPPWALRTGNIVIPLLRHLDALQSLKGLSLVAIFEKSS